MDCETEPSTEIGVRITDELDRKIEAEAERRGVDKSVALIGICYEVLSGSRAD